MFVLKNVCYKNILEVSYLHLAARAISCIIGESGSGKTTLLKLLNHFIDCEAGLVEYRGRDIKTLDPVQLRREVVLLPQAPVVFPGTVKHNLLIGMKFAGRELADDALLVQIMHELGLEKGLDGDAGNLSGGQRQRLALGRVMLMDPAVMLLDEPTANLDDDTEKMTMDTVINYIKSRGKTLVMVTHSKQLAKKYADSIITVYNGTIAGVEEVA